MESDDSLKLKAWLLSSEKPFIFCSRFYLYLPWVKKQILDVFTARCYAECGILLRKVVCLSVSLSVTLSVLNVEVSWSHRLEFFENNFTVNCCRPNITDLLETITRSFRRNRGGVRKMWHSAYRSYDISETR